jgi:hypothetical protein
MTVLDCIGPFVVYRDLEVQLPVAHLPSVLPHRALCGELFAEGLGREAQGDYLKCPDCTAAWKRRA